MSLIQSFKSSELGKVLASWFTLTRTNFGASFLTSLIAFIVMVVFITLLSLLIGAIAMSVIESGGGNFLNMSNPEELLKNPFSMFFGSNVGISVILYMILFFMIICSALSYIWGWAFHLMFIIKDKVSRGEEASFGKAFPQSLGTNWKRMGMFFLLLSVIQMFLYILNAYILYQYVVTGSGILYYLSLLVSVVIPILIYTKFILTPAFICKENQGTVEAMSSSWNAVENTRFWKYAIVGIVITFAFSYLLGFITEQLVFVPLATLWLLLLVIMFLAIYMACYTAASVALYFRLTEAGEDTEEDQALFDSLITED